MLRRLPRLALGVILGFLAGAVTLVAGLGGAALLMPAEAGAAVWRVASLLAASLGTGDTGPLLAMAAAALWRALLVAVLLPVSLVVVVAEAAGLRGWAWPVLGGGGLAAALPLALFEAGGDAPALGPGVARWAALLFVAGAAGGLVARAVAGGADATGAAKT